MSAPRASTLSQQELLHIGVHWHERTAIVALDGELDYATAPALTAWLADVLAQGPGRLVLDLASLTFIDCAGLTPILQCRSTLPAGFPLILRSPTRAVRRFLAFTRADQICDLRDI